MIHLHSPGGRLASHIDVLWLVENTSRAGRIERVLPSGAAQIIINLHDEPIGPGVTGQGQPVDTAVILGARLEHLVIDTRSIAACLGIAFKPGGAAAFLPLPVTQLRGRCVSLDTFWGAESEFLRERLSEARSPRQRFETLERFLAQKLVSTPDRIHRSRPFVGHAVSALEQWPSAAGLADLRQRCGYGTTRFTSLFSEAVGLTPKQFARVRRFQRVLGALFARQEADWADTALRFGYYDQSHFIHEFRAFTGITPGNYFAKRIEDRNHLAL